MYDTANPAKRPHHEVRKIKEKKRKLTGAATLPGTTHKTPDPPSRPCSILRPKCKPLRQTVLVCRHTAMLREESAPQHTPSRPDTQPGMQTHGASSHARHGLRPKLPGLLANHGRLLAVAKARLREKKKLLRWLRGDRGGPGKHRVRMNSPLVTTPLWFRSILESCLKMFFHS